MNRNRTRWATPTLALVVVLSMTTPAVVTASAKGQAQRSHAPVFAFTDPETRIGDSTLQRGADDIKMKLQTDHVTAGDALTVWWMVFNQPDACTPPACGEDDIFVDGDPRNPLNEAQIEAADIVAAFATGKVASSKGHARFSAKLAAFEPDGTREIIFGTGPALKDAAGAEVHLIVRSHGPAVPELLDGQLSSYVGGSDHFLTPPSVPTSVGECAEIQFAVHTP